METKYEKIKEVAGDIGIGCALVLVAPIYLLGNALYNTSAGEKTRHFLTSFKSKSKKKKFFLEELKSNNDEYEITSHILKDGGYTREVEPNHMNNFRYQTFFHELNEAEKQKYVEKLANLNNSRKNIERKLCKF